MIYIKELHKKHFDNNDIYVLETTPNNIVINDDYHGLLLLDFSLNTQKAVPIKEGTTIYSLYKESPATHLAIYSPDQEEIIIANINTNKYDLIAIPGLINELVFTPIYYWKNDTLVFTTYDYSCHQICFVTHTIKEISTDEVKKISLSFFNFLNESKKYNILTSYPEDLSVIFQEDEETIGFLDIENNKQVMIQHQNDGWHDVQYTNNTFIFVYEKKIEIIYHDIKILLHPDSNYIFLRAKFISETTIVGLSSKPGNHRDSLLQIYQLMYTN